MNKLNIPHVRAYRKKPVMICALEFTGDNTKELFEFCPMAREDTFCLKDTSPYVYIKTLEGDMKVSTGDFVIQGVNGEFYPCKPDIFEKTYEEVK